jgi:hypothetical protein
MLPDKYSLAVKKNVSTCLLPFSFCWHPVPFRHGERIGFSYLVSQKYTGEKAHVKLLRNSKVREFNIKLAIHKKLIPAHIKGRPPSYYIVAGFVFMVVSVPYLRSEVWYLLPLPSGPRHEIIIKI